jgi:thiamine transporter
MKNKEKIITISEIAIFTAIAFVLDFAATLYSGYIFPNGGSFSLAILPLVVLSFRRGPVAGIFAGFILGLLDLTDGFYTYSDTWYKAFIQIGFDYIFTYMLVGLVGLFKPLVKKCGSFVIILISIFTAGFLKFTSHFLSGVLFWPEFPNQPFLDRCIYSLLYNGSYMLPTTIICCVIGLILVKTYKKMFLIEE